MHKTAPNAAHCLDDLTLDSAALLRVLRSARQLLDWEGESIVPAGPEEALIDYMAAHSRAADPMVLALLYCFRRLYGAGVARIRRQAERYAAAVERFAARFGPGPAALARAPARINILGEHVDYVSYLPTEVLTFASREHDMLMVFRPNDAGRVRGDTTLAGEAPAEFGLEECPGAVGQASCLSPEFGHVSQASCLSQAEAPAPGGAKGADALPLSGQGDLEGRWLTFLQETGTPPRHWMNYVKAGAFYCALKHPGLKQGFDFLLDSTLPAAGGASSSSTIVVLSGAAFRTVNGVAFDAETLAQDSAKAEFYVGTRGGNMDHCTMCLARRQHALHLDFEPFRTAPVPLHRYRYRWMAFFSHPADKGGDVLLKFNERSAVARLVIPSLLKRLCDGDPALRDKWERAVRALRDEPAANCGASVPLADATRGARAPLADATRGASAPLADATRGARAPLADATRGASVPLADATRGASVPLAETTRGASAPFAKASQRLAPRGTDLALEVLSHLPETVSLDDFRADFPEAYAELEHSYPRLAQAMAAQLIKVRARAMHHAGEVARVREAVRIFQEVFDSRMPEEPEKTEPALRAVGDVLTETHESLRDLYGVSTPDIEDLSGILLGHPGVYGARLMGGGFGGNVLALVSKEHVAELVDRVQNRYYAPRGRDALAEGSITVSTPGEGFGPLCLRSILRQAAVNGSAVWWKWGAYGPAVEKAAHALLGVARAEDFAPKRPVLPVVVAGGRGRLDFEGAYRSPASLNVLGDKTSLEHVLEAIRGLPFETLKPVLVISPAMEDIVRSAPEVCSSPVRADVGPEQGDLAQQRQRPPLRTSDKQVPSAPVRADVGEEQGDLDPERQKTPLRAHYEPGAHYEPWADLAVQRHPLGTGDAVLSALPLIPESGCDVLVVWGSQPLLTTGTLLRSVLAHQALGTSAMLFPTAVTRTPYAPIQRDLHGYVTASRETAGGKATTRRLGETNVGAFVLRAEALVPTLARLREELWDGQAGRYCTATGELGFPNEMARALVDDGQAVIALPVAAEEESLGLRDRAGYEEAKRRFADRGTC